MRRDRPDAKLACLRMLTQLNLNPAQIMLLSGFIDTYLDLDQREEEQLQQQLDRIETREKEGVMEIVTSWMRQGLEQGIEIGTEQERQQSRQREVALLLKILNRKVGELSTELEQRVSSLSFEQLDALGDAVLTFSSEIDLHLWLAHIGA